jgi:hypothetical protein
VNEHQHEKDARRFKFSMSTGTKLPRTRVLRVHPRAPYIQHPSSKKDNFCDIDHERNDGDSSNSNSGDSSEDECDEVKGAPGQV